MKEKLKAITYGHAIGDALGVPVEFSLRADLKSAPVKDMIGYGQYRVPKGTWSDDTSMALCTMDGLREGKTYHYIMENFKKWLYKGEFTPYGHCFDVGGTCRQAITNYAINGNYRECGLDDFFANGNGSLMRIYPVSLYVLRHNDLEDRIREIHNISRLTHSHEISLIGCGIYSFVLWELLENPKKSSIKKGIQKAFNYYKNYPFIEEYRRLIEIEWYKEEHINSTGFVVDTLEASLWCLLNTDNFEDCVLRAVNLGGDTDTIGAITGSLAGALYGYENIPKKWIKSLKNKDLIEEISNKFWEEAIDG